jgi:hypothetical protein
MQTLSKTIKNHSWKAFGIKLSVMLIFLWILYFQFKTVNWENDFLKELNPLPGFIVLALIPLNWFCEFKKWQISVKFLSKTFERRNIQNSFLAGVITGMLTPNMLGNFVGRVFYFPRKYRIDLIILTTLSNFSQFVWSIVFGAIGIALVNYNDYVNAVWLSFILIIVLVATFFFFDKFLLYFPLFRKWVKRFSSFNFPLKLKIQFLSWSWLRHLIFSLQFMGVLMFFNQAFSLQLLFWIWQVYFWVTLSPSLFLGKIVIRETIAVWVLTSAGLDPEIVIVSSLSIWILNLFIPTVISLILCKPPIGISE